MSSFIDTIKTHAESISSVIDPDTTDPYQFTFHHCEDHEFNTEDSTLFPFVFLRHPLNADNPVNAVGQVDSIYQCAFFFGHKSKKEQTMSERQARVDQMEQAKNEFIRIIFNDDSLEIVGTPKSNEMFDDFDFNSDGWYLFMNLKVKDVSPC